MPDYFKPLRRKIGVLMLGMACVFAVGWIRSLVELDAIFRLDETSTHSLISADGRISWTRIWPIMKPRPSRWMYRHNEASGQDDSKEGFDVHWGFTGMGFDFCAISNLEAMAGVAPYTQEFEIWQIPYWSIVVPLTLLSLYLLLSKPRANTSVIHPVPSTS